MTRAKPPESKPRHTEPRSTSPGDAGSYYGRPIVKPPVWDKDIAWYFFFGGLAGASATLAAAARRSGNAPLARAATLAAAAGVTVSPVLLIRDLGRPARFLNMLRVVKPTSPMNVGTWILSAEGAATGVAAVLELSGRLPRVRAFAERAGGALGPALATYTAVLVADTAIPVWHEARLELPVVFAASSAASAGAAAMLLAPAGSAGPARRLLIGGVAVESAASVLMERRLGKLAGPYRGGEGARYARLSRGLNLTGAAVALLGGGHRPLAAAAAASALAGAVCRRFSVYKAGFDSALDPRYTVEPQRQRMEEARRRAATA